MFSRIYGAVLFGLNGCLITVETDIANGLPSFDIVGLATVAVKEAKERVRTAVKNSGLAFPVRRITVNLAPADMKKEDRKSTRLNSSHEFVSRMPSSA